MEETDSVALSTVDFWESGLAFSWTSAGEMLAEARVSRRAMNLTVTNALTAEIRHDDESGLDFVDDLRAKKAL